MKKILILLILAMLFGCSANQKILMPSTQYQSKELLPYRIQTGDILNLNVVQRVDLSGEYTVGPDGSLALPVIGNISIHNLTREQAEEKIRAALKSLYSPITVVLKIKTYQSSAFFVIIGEVEEPGVYPLKNQLSLVKAIGMARGLTADAAKNKVKLIRNNSKQGVTIINLNDILKKGDFSQDYILEKDDMIYIQSKKISSWLYPLKQLLPVVQVGLLALISINQL